MLSIYIKNHLKLMLRKKWLIAVMIIFPLLLIAALSSVFGDLMDRDIVLEEITIGYDMNDNTNIPITPLEELLSENKVTLQKVDIKDKDRLLKEGNIVAFVEINEDGYTLYKTPNYEREIAVVENICYSFFQQSRVTNINQEDLHINTQELDIAPLPSAVDYYGIIEIVYFTWFGFMALTSILSSERKYNILNRIQVTSVSKWTVYLAKFIPAVTACFIEMIISIILSYLLFGVNFGNLALSLGIILLSIMASIAFSIMVFTFFKQLLIGIAIMYFSGFVMGFIGGSFQMYMFAPFSESIKNLSPIYHTNRALVELSTSGSSDYVVTSILVLSAICVVCSLIVILRMHRKEGFV